MTIPFFSEHTYPEADDGRQPDEGYGELAAKMLIDAIEGKENAGERGEPECDIKIEPRFVVREHGESQKIKQ